MALSQSTFASRRRWASIFGLVGQPFWFYAAWDTQQWGIFALCILYTITWGKGFYSNWIAAMAAPQAQPADALDAEAAIEELSQLGYTFKDGRLIPPDHVGELMAVVQASACGCQYGTCETKANRACRMTAEIAAMAAAQEGGNV
ncbi:hypothetical protein D3C72_1960420 [compost metagenome]